MRFFKTTIISLVLPGLNVSCYGRAVKATDLKSVGVTRTGSNPVGSESFLDINLLITVS
jgi:hypothetical protein